MAEEDPRRLRRHLDRWRDQQRKKDFRKFDALGMTEPGARLTVRACRRAAWTCWAPGVGLLAVSSLANGWSRTVIILVGLGLVAVGCVIWDAAVRLREWIHARWGRTTRADAPPTEVGGP